MKFDTVYNLLPAHGWLTKDEARLLWDTAVACVGAILEVGSYYGRSTVLLASTGRQVHSVDPFVRFDDADPSGDIIRASLLKNLHDRSLHNVTQHRCPIEEWQPVMVGFAYLDGDHTYQGTLRQIEKAMLCGAPVIAIHDVNDSGGGLEVKRAALHLLGSWDNRVERLAVWHRTLG